MQIAQNQLFAFSDGILNYGKNYATIRKIVFCAISYGGVVYYGREKS